MDMARRRAQQEDGAAQHSRQPEIEAPEGSDETHDREAQARRADLELKGAVGPADVGRGEPPEEDVADEVVEIAHADGEEDVPGQQLLDHGLAPQRSRRARHRRQRHEATQHQAAQREVGEDQGE